MKSRTMLAVAFPVLAALVWTAPAQAHCDTLDGPVVSAARKALDSGDVNLVLVWVQKNDEAEIRSAFQQAHTVRKSGGEARDLADRYFFETLVRVHRAGEGAGYAGQKYNPRDVEAGRAYSSAYVEFVHYAERLYEAAETMAPEHVQKAATKPAHTH